MLGFLKISCMIERMMIEYEIYILIPDCSMNDANSVK